MNRQILIPPSAAAASIALLAAAAAAPTTTLTSTQQYVGLEIYVLDIDKLLSGSYSIHGHNRRP